MHSGEIDPAPKGLNPPQTDTPPSGGEGQLQHAGHQHVAGLPVLLVVGADLDVGLVIPAVEDRPRHAKR